MSNGADEYGNRTARVRDKGEWLRVEFDGYQRRREVLMQLANEAVVAAGFGVGTAAGGIGLSGHGGSVI